MKTAEQLVEELREHLKVMPDHLRVEIFHAVAAGYCEYCGREEPPGDYCSCRNDE